MDPKRWDKLDKRRKRLAALFPLVSDDKRRREIEAELRMLDAELGLAPFKPLGRKSAVGLDGTGALKFQALAPPGVGRLVSIPFYLTSFQDPLPGSAAPWGQSIITDAGTNTFATTAFPSVANPIVIAAYTNNNAVAAGVSVTSGLVFLTPIVPWTVLRLVGIRVSSRWSYYERATALPGSPFPYGIKPQILLSNLQVGGGANLFPHEGYIDATNFDVNVPEIVGLRDYSVVTRPNRVSVLAAIQNYNAGNVQNVNQAVPISLTFSISMICDVLDDDDVGRSIPGPYARKGALHRRPFREGTSLVVR